MNPALFRELAREAALTLAEGLGLLLDAALLLLGALLCAAGGAAVAYAVAALGGWLAGWGG